MIAFLLKEVEWHYPTVISNSKFLVFMNLRFSGADTFINLQFINLFNMTGNLENCIGNT